MSKQRAFKTFRMMFKEFTYESYHYEQLEDGFHLSFRFSLNDKLVFEPTAFFPTRSFLNFDQPKELLDRMVFNIGMIELISYWKACCPPTVVVKCAPYDFLNPADPKASEETLHFWKKLYWNGLGEFFWVNDIKTTYDEFLTIRVDRTVNKDYSAPLFPATNSEAFLVPIGGGKDSVVTIEALRGAGKHVCPLIMNPRGATTLCAQEAGFSLEDTLVIRRTIHPLLLDINKQGCLNGHTPFSAMLAFYTLLASLFSGVRNIALSNESSANESTVPGTDVNHQYSKSLEFENDFRHYVSRLLFPRQAADEVPNYFSFLRPLSELQIAMLFAQNEQYYPVFKSCNAGCKQDIWCGNCPKCLFAYIILSPFIEPAKLQQIFGKDLFDDPQLQLYFDQLTGKEPTKPFECVGTIDEVNTAVAMTLDRWYVTTPRPTLLQGCQPPQPTVQLNTYFEQHNLDNETFNVLKQCIEKAN